MEDQDVMKASEALGQLYLGQELEFRFGTAVSGTCPLKGQIPPSQAAVRVSHKASYLTGKFTGTAFW